MIIKKSFIWFISAAFSFQLLGCSEDSQEGFRNLSSSSDLGNTTAKSEETIEYVVKDDETIEDEKIDDTNLKEDDLLASFLTGGNVRLHDAKAMSRIYKRVFPDLNLEITGGCVYHQEACDNYAFDLMSITMMKTLDIRLGTLEFRPATKVSLGYLRALRRSASIGCSSLVTSEFSSITESNTLVRRDGLPSEEDLLTFARKLHGFPKNVPIDPKDLGVEKILNEFSKVPEGTDLVPIYKSACLTMATDPILFVY